MSKQSGIIAQLHASLDSRLRPEDVAGLILASDEVFTPHERRMLARVAQARPKWWYSSMSSDFARPVDASGQLAVLGRLFGVDSNLRQAVTDLDSLRLLAANAGEGILWRPGVDFKERLNREDRKANGIELSRRQYNRAWRFLIRLDAKIGHLETELRKRELMLAGRSGLAADITLDRFGRDPSAACFVAYLVARKNLRRQFSLSGKTNPFDEIADMLFRRLGEGSDWWMVARVHPQPHVLAHLSQADLGELLGRWSALMRGAVQILKQAWDPQVNRTTMIVRRGMDSSTWNTVAQAYNTARAGWLNVLSATGLEVLLDAACPGKVMRLMAANLAYWHRSTGSDVDPDTAVWAALPLPWQVLDGEASCTRAYVEQTCRRFGVDPQKRGWTAARATGRVAWFEPTPELVHGVSIADPTWATLLRNAGAFSGKRINAGYEGLAVPAEVVASDLPSKAPYL
jgi:hypothetical protein